MAAFYAEDQVDRVVREAFFADYSYKGVFVEVGAASPDYLSMSRHFRDSGWQVLAVEPNPHFCRLHRAAGLSVCECAAGSEDRDGVEFHLVHCPGEYQGGQVTYESFSSLGVKDSYRALRPDLREEVIRVKVRRLDTILREHLPLVRRVDVVSVDVEGWELEVLEGFSLHRYRPRVLVVENNFDAPEYSRWLDGHGYTLWRTVPPNQIYVRRTGRDNLYRAGAQLVRRFARWPARLLSRVGGR